MNKNSILKITANFKHISNSDISKLKDELFQKINIKDCVFDDISKVKCDLEKTVWVIVNLLNNAVRYSSQKGKIKISAKSENKLQTYFLILH